MVKKENIINRFLYQYIKQIKLYAVVTVVVSVTIISTETHIILTHYNKLVTLLN